MFWSTSSPSCESVAWQGNIGSAGRIHPCSVWLVFWQLGKNMEKWKWEVLKSCEKLRIWYDFEASKAEKASTSSTTVLPFHVGHTNLICLAWISLDANIHKSPRQRIGPVVLLLKCHNHTVLYRRCLNEFRCALVVEFWGTNGWPIEQFIEPSTLKQNTVPLRVLSLA